VAAKPPMFSRFLLHDPSDMSGSEKGKFSCWGGVLEWHRRFKEAFCILESLLCRDHLLQCFGPSLQEISPRAQNLCAFGQKMTVKIYHAKKMLQLFDILRGWAKFDFSGMISRGGRSCRRNRVAKDFQRRSCKNTFVKINGETIGVQSSEKSLQVAEVCLPFQRTDS
jgi:hypothetical protein